MSLYSLQDPRHTKKGGWIKHAARVEGGLPRRRRAVDREREVGLGAGSAASAARSSGPASSTVTSCRGGTDGGPEQIFDCQAYAVGTAPGGMAVDLVYPQRDLAEDNTLRGQAQLVAYLGPKYLDRLEAIAGVEQFDPEFEKAVDLGFWGFIAGPLLGSCASLRPGRELGHRDHPAHHAGEARRPSTGRTSR